MRHYGKQMISVQVTQEFKDRMWAVADLMGVSLSDIARMTMERGLAQMEGEERPTHWAP